MTDIVTASTDRTDAAAGEALARQLAQGLGGKTPDALIVFASAQNDYQALLRALHEPLKPKHLVGCSSAGEFTAGTSGTGMTSAIAIVAPQMRFAAALGARLSAGRPQAASSIVGAFEGMRTTSFRHRTAILFVDALAGYAEDLVDHLTMQTAGAYQFVGGGAGDDGKFSSTHVFFGTEAHTDAAVALEILSNAPIGIGAQHGWRPSGNPLRVTESSDACMLSLNAAPAVEAFEDHARSTGQRLEHENPLPFFLHNIVGVKTEDGHKLRVPLGIQEAGGVVCAAEVPTGATAHIMATRAEDARRAAAAAVADAVAQVERAGHKPSGALFLDCVATRLRLGQEFEGELDAVREALKGTPFVGFNSYGQIVRAEGQFNGFHNCTAVVCVFPD